MEKNFIRGIKISCSGFKCRYYNGYKKKDKNIWK